MKKLLELKRVILEEFEIFRLKVVTHPKVIIWRLRLFGVHPFLGNHVLKIMGARGKEDAK